MRRWGAAVAAVLVAGAVHAQPTGVVVGSWSNVGPFRGTVAQLGSVGCSEGTEKIFLVTDGASDSDCSLGGGAFGVLCVCLDGAWVAGAGGGDVSSVFGRTGDVVAVAGDYDAPEISYTPTTGADWTDPDPADAGAALDDLAGRATTHEADASAHHAKTTDAAEITTGTLAHERGGLEADVSAFGGLVRIDTGSTTAVSNLAGLNTAIGASVADGAHFTPDVDPGVDHSSYVAGHGDGANCAAGNYPLGVDAAGAVQGCTPAGGGAGGGDGQVQYNDGGAFGGMAGALWDDVAEELTIQGTTDAASERVLVLAGPDRATPATGDTAYISLISEWPAQFREAGRITWTTNANDGAQSSKVEIGVNKSGTTTTGLMVSSYGLSTPAVFFPAGTSSTPGINFGLFSGGDNDGCYLVSNGIVACVSNGIESFRWQQGKLVVPSAGVFNFSTDTGLSRDAASRIKVTDGSTGTGSILYGAEIADPAVRTCADSGDANPGTLVAGTSGATYLPVVNNDADGCSLSLSETGATDGQRLEAIVRATAGGTVDINDTAGLHLMTGNFSMGLGDAITFRYDATLNAWVEISRSNN